MSETKRPLPVGVWHEEKQPEKPESPHSPDRDGASDADAAKSEQEKSQEPQAPEVKPEDSTAAGTQTPETPAPARSTDEVPETPAPTRSADEVPETPAPARSADEVPETSGSAQDAGGTPETSAPARGTLTRAVRRASRSGEERVRSTLRLQVAFGLLAAGILIALCARMFQERRDASAGTQSAPSPASVPSSVASLPEPEKEDPLAPADPDLWSLLLANTQNPLPEGYEPELVDTGNGQYVDSRILEPLENLFEAAEKDGIDLYVRSAYRSEETQRVLFNQLQSEYMAMGYSRQEAFELAKKLRNLPGTSEHQTGLAVDIVSADAPGVNLVASLAQTEWAQWLEENAADYGFILRYPEGKTEITGTSFEPWHYRYVGVEDARKIMDAGLCLEEYLGKIPDEALPAVEDTSDDSSSAASPQSARSASQQGGKQ